MEPFFYIIVLAWGGRDEICTQDETKQAWFVAKGTIWYLFRYPSQFGQVAACYCHLSSQLVDITGYTASDRHDGRLIVNLGKFLNLTS